MTRNAADTDTVPFRDTDFRAKKGVSRKGNGRKGTHDCSDTDFRAEKGVSRKGERKEKQKNQTLCVLEKGLGTIILTYFEY